MTATAVCSRCGDLVVKQGWFWVRATEVGTGMASFCVGDYGLHDVDDDDDEQ